MSVYFVMPGVRHNARWDYGLARRLPLAGYFQPAFGTFTIP